MKLRTALITSIVAIILQPFFLSLLPEALAPNLGFCLLILCAVAMDEKEAILPFLLIIIVSFFVDFFSNQFVGAAAISMTFVVAILFMTRRRLDLDNPFFLAGIAVGSNIVYEIVYWTVYRIMGIPYGFLYMLKNLPTAIIVDTVITFIGLLLVARELGRIRRESYFKDMNW